jgi:integrase
MKLIDVGVDAQKVRRHRGQDHVVVRRHRDRDPMRAIFECRFKNKLILNNPAEGVSLDVKSKQSEKKRSFTDEEAKTILRAASAEKDPVKRWVPWIGAYWGARVSEICQLRSEDVLRIDDIWCMKLDREAGSLKTSGSERIFRCTQP